MGAFYEQAEPYDPQLPEHREPDTVAICPECGTWVRRVDGRPYCDRHGHVAARWVTVRPGFCSVCGGELDSEGWCASYCINGEVP